MYKKIIYSKFFWTFMVVLAFSLMIIGFFTKDLKMWIVAFLISILVRMYAKDTVDIYKNNFRKYKAEKRKR